MKKIVLLFIISCTVSAPVFAADAKISAVEKTLKSIMPNASPDSVRESVINDMYEVVYGAQVLYITGNGKFMLEGDLYDVGRKVNLTENTRQSGRLKVLNGLDKNSLIVFKPEGQETKFVLTVFTDIDCGYCRKLHEQMKDYTSKGIEIHYAAFPRSGLNTPSYYKAAAVWCAKDQNKAMTFAKGGANLDQLKNLEQVSNEKCKDPIAKHLQTAREIGVTGTPTLFMANGQMIPGYVPPERLIKILEESSKI